MERKSDTGVRHSRLRCDTATSFTDTDQEREWDQPRGRQDRDRRQRSKSPRHPKHSRHLDHHSRRSESPGDGDGYHHHHHREGSAGQRSQRRHVQVLQRTGHSSSLPGRRPLSELNSGFRGSSPDVIELDDGDGESVSSREAHGASAGQGSSPPTTFEDERHVSPVESEKLCSKAGGDGLKPKVACDAGGTPLLTASSLPQLAGLAGLQPSAVLDASISSSIQILQYFQQQQQLLAAIGLTGLGQPGFFPGHPLSTPYAMPCANALHAPLHPCSCMTCQSALLSQDCARYLPQYAHTGQLPLPVAPMPMPPSQSVMPPANQDVQALLQLLRQNDGRDSPASDCQECACNADCEEAACTAPPCEQPAPATPQRTTALPPMQQPVHLKTHQGLPGSPQQSVRGLQGPTPAAMTPLRQALTSTLCSSPLHSLMTQLNESGLSAVSAIQFQSPDRHNSSRGKYNPPIGVFWDIENCAVPRGKSALAVVQRIRDRFFAGHREAEFMCVCDINKESSTIIQELNDAQVTVAHINATAKNAADDKLRQSLRRFADTHSPPATVVLISGDINFARDLSDLRHRNGLNVILIHGQAASEALKTCANKSERYDELLADLPFRSPAKTGSFESSELVIHNLPPWKDNNLLRARLKQLSENCGGRVGNVVNNTGFIKFPSHEIASRAKKRLDGEKVYGNVINTSFSRGRPGFGSPRYLRHNYHRRDTESFNESRERQDEVSSHDSSSSQGTSEPPKEEVKDGRDQSCSQHGPCPKPTPMPSSRYVENASPLGGRTNMEISRGLAEAFRPIQPMPPASDPAHVMAPPPPPPGSINLVMDGAAKGPYPPHLPPHPPHPPPPPPSQSCDAPNSSGRSEWKPLIPTPPPPQESTSYGSGATFRPIPAVQRIAGSQGPYMNLRKDGTPGNPCLKGCYRAPSPLMVTSKLKPSWQQQQQQQPQGVPVPPGVKPWTPMPGIDLLVTNLDIQMSRKELKRHLVAAISEHCRVLHVFLAAPSQGHFQAVVRVPSMGDAIGVLANVNRKQIGSRILHLSIMPPGDCNADRLRMMLIQMLQEVPGMSMPLCKLKPGFENKYQQQLYVADLYQIPDTVTMKDGPVGKLVCLTAHSASNSPAPGSYSSPMGWQSPAMPFVPPREPSPEPPERYCSQHDSDGQSQYRLLDTDLCVMVAYQSFTAQVTTLLHMHNGSMSLLSFPLCYQSEFDPLEEDFERGIPLEHLLSSVPGVRVAFCREGFKVVCWSQQKEEIITEDGQPMCPPLLGRATPLLPPPLFQFSKEVVELLKHSNKCRLPFTRFVPAYHHHFGRQVRVADYGYLKLIELFEAISHVLEILGATENKTLTLTHRSQVKRFGQDLLKVLKSQASKKVTIHDFPSAFQRCLGRPWNTVDYGVCDVQDLLFDLPENWVTIEWDGDNTEISIPKREQTDEERIRTRKFSREIVDLLSRQPRCRITFSKFIPAYHHHFGRQCRVGEYGFNKLAELLGALPEVVQIEESGDERCVRLSEAERLSVMARRISQLVPRNRQHSLALSALLPAYCKVFGHPVCLEDYGVRDLEALVRRFCHMVEIITEDDDKRLRSVERQHLSDLTQQILVVLLLEPQGRALVEQAQRSYAQVWGQELVATQYGFSSVTLLMKALHHVVTVKDEWSDDPAVELTPTYQFARSARAVLLGAPSQTLSLQAFVARYQTTHGCELQPYDYGQTTISALISSVPRVLTLMGRGSKRAIMLNPCCNVSGGGNTYQDPSLSSEDTKASQSTGTAPSSSNSEKDSRKSSSSNSTSESDLMKASPPTCPEDLLTQGATPSGDQAPFLEPSIAPIPPARDLISFTSPSHSLPEAVGQSSGQAGNFEHIDLMQLIHLLPDKAGQEGSGIGFGLSPTPTQLNPASYPSPASLPHSMSFSVDGSERPIRQASSLPSSAASSPRRDLARGRSRFRLAANFSLGFQDALRPEEEEDM
ncbi:meiosis regulator and mRNA stability factor 1-like [Diadema antillarum]|uniref:meiosis regulator and mRNA stability factor 1-like n=1 Tax=Diadema antillarum TaxID=105358 RepID=UPI003A8C29C3